LNSKKILWFTDTLNDLNGVSVTLKKIGTTALESGRDIRIVTSLRDEERSSDIPSSTIVLPHISSFKLPFYEKIHLKIPSLMKALEIIHDHDPDEIFISTPGPVGMLGLMAGKIMNKKMSGIYHTDFTMQAKEITADDSIFTMVERGVSLFYSQMDRIFVPSMEYMNLLESRGYDRSKMELFRRGVDPAFHSPVENARSFMKERFNIHDGIKLAFAGRISPDKNLDVLLDAFSELSAKRNDVHLILAGDGPYLPELKKRYSKNAHVHFAGYLSHKEMPALYSGADLLVFPGHTDTFGMAVLEAQTCGLPALVSDQGGPREIIQPGVTGTILPAFDVNAWIGGIESHIRFIEESPMEYRRMREETRKHALKLGDWSAVLDQYMGIADTDEYKGIDPSDSKSAGGSRAALIA
jgi:glycosyltransferase involved in cell wall biosynthesis